MAELAIVPFVLSECVRRRLTAWWLLGSSEVLEMVDGERDICWRGHGGSRGGTGWNGELATNDVDKFCFTL